MERKNPTELTDMDNLQQTQGTFKPKLKNLVNDKINSLNQIYRNLKIEIEIETENKIKICRICYEQENLSSDNILINPCLCQGSMQFIHESCLKTWISNNNNFSKFVAFCEICKYYFQMTSKKKLIFSKIKCKKFFERVLTITCSMLMGILLLDFLLYVITLK